MDINSILFPVLSLGGMSILFGLGLGYAGIKFKVETDPKVPLLRDALPGANCGGCGYAGCDALAAAIAAGEAKTNACPVGGKECTFALSEIMGVEAELLEPSAAYVKCSGDCNNAEWRYDYIGLDDCAAAMQLTAGGAKKCSYGCIGAGSCVRSCDYGAISIDNGIAVIDKDKCVACGKCTDVCPKKIIELVPKKNSIRVACSSKDAGKTVRGLCKTGCIGCKLCQKACEHGAVVIEDTLAKVDYSKCVLCGDCVKKCPTKAISNSFS